MSESPHEFAGTIIITWPQSRGGVLPGWAITLTDEVTGGPIRTVTALRVVLNAAADELVWAECEMFADADGKPILNGEPLVAPEGMPLTGTFPFLVSEMRVAEAAP